MSHLLGNVSGGFSVLLLDFLAWRLMGPALARLRSLFRAILFLALTFVLFSSGMSPLSPPEVTEGKLHHLFAQGLELVWWLQGAQLVTVLLDFAILPAWWRRERLFRDLLRALVFLAAALASIAYVLELPIRGLLATSGAVAIILGLAIQSTLNDVFSGLVLNATEPFKLGDWIAIDDVEGQVAETNWRATSLLTGQGNLVVVPNSVAAKAKIVNHNEPSQIHGINVTLEISPEIRPARVLEALERAASSASDILAIPKPTVNVRKAKTDSIEYEIVCYVDALGKKATARNALFDLSHRHLASVGIDLRPLSVRYMGGVMSDHRARLLRGVAMFRQLDDAEFEVLDQALVRKEFESGDVIYALHEQDQASAQALYIIASGVVRVTSVQQKAEIELRRLAPGDAIGHSAILSGAGYPSVATALTAVVVYCLDRSNLTPVIQRRPELGRQMCRWLVDNHRTDGAFVAVPANQPSTEAGMFGWLKEGMHRLHDLVV
ncbi:mechanosensitive ion channel family protein [Paraburkholderia sp. BL25I1N1]|uniref:mechanosensitive ion channel family protein n=1 Tax=Paraburkholderia sp. BL25I1N1 TaxID=1938804 RepID=UPI000D04DABB|nr:mechanosensitive ion channel family protein [Paraburkholderia sp. BL25I1N1]PRY04444.1 small-conductance mechanosensitive channel [Paraburkholderia sp. BL25I1N1]